MPDATVATATIRPEEAAHFAALAKDWWDPKGSSAMLHRLNPVRLAFIREAIDLHWGGDVAAVRPLAGKAALDVGCGAGLLSEPLARLGAKVVGVDASPEVIAVAREHAAIDGLDIDYRLADVAGLGGAFDLVTAMEVVEHVAEPAAFVRALAKRLAPGGLLMMSTPNATAMSRLMMIVVAEGLGHIPRGTHDFDKFIPPERLKALLGEAGLKCLDVEGVAWSPWRGIHLSDDLRLNYLVSAVHA